MNNILHLRSSAGLYGAEHVILNLTQVKSNDCRHTVLIFENHLNHNQDFYHAAIDRNIAAIKLPCNGRLDWKTVKILKQQIQTLNCNVIHCHDPKSVFYAFLATMFNRKISKVVTMHGWVKNDRNMKFNNYVEKLCLPFFDKIIAVSDEIKNQLLATSIPNNKVTYIPNAVNIDKFIPHSPASDKQFNKIKMLIVGRLSPEKGHLNLLLALNALKQKSFDNWQLSIIGDGELKKVLMDKVIELKLEQEVEFLGVQKEMVAFYQQHNAYISSSLSEGMPLVILEAMACQLPIVATPVGAIPDLINGSQGGFLCENNSIESLTDSIEKLLVMSNAQLKETAKNGREYILKHYSLKAATSRHESLYHAVNLQKQ